MIPETKVLPRQSFGSVSAAFLVGDDLVLETCLRENDRHGCPVADARAPRVRRRLGYLPPGRPLQNTAELASISRLVRDALLLMVETCCGGWISWRLPWVLPA